MKNDKNLAVIDSIDDMADLIRLGSYANEHIIHALADGPVIACNDVVWYPPLRRPGKICGVAMNNSASNERKISAPSHPAFFLKPSSCLVGHNESVRVRPYYGSVHPEPELAVVIGKTARDIDADDAMACVFGYSIFNDITGNGMRAEDLFHYWALYPDEQNPGELKRREQHLSYAARYKGTDTFGCMGPVITTADEVSNPDDLDVSCKVGGETVAEDSTRYYNYKVAELISYISQFLTLEPGDVISCGTAFKPSPNRKSIHQANFQQVEGPVEVTISGLGTLFNPVEIENKALGKWRLS
jgi:2-keto-4-pentenoate hydratase/2-oxohepta-3-ene-1,7-dioic acid hydratase in catechol pathway